MIKLRKTNTFDVVYNTKPNEQRKQNDLSDIPFVKYIHGVS